MILKVIKFNYVGKDIRENILQQIINNADNIKNAFSLSLDSYPRVICYNSFDGLFTIGAYHKYSTNRDKLENMICRKSGPDIQQLLKNYGRSTEFKGTARFDIIIGML